MHWKNSESENLYIIQTVAIIKQPTVDIHAGICFIGGKKRESSENITKEGFLIIWLISYWALKFGESMSGPQLDCYLIYLKECGTAINPFRRGSDEEE